MLAAPFRVILWALSLVTFAYASCDARNQVSSWENTTFIDAGWKSPSAPFICQHLWNSSEVESFESVRAFYRVTRYELEAWNCFLSSADGPTTPNTAYCVDAVLDPADLDPAGIPPPPFTRPVQTLVPVESQSTGTLWPRQETASSAPEHTNTTFNTWSTVTIAHDAEPTAADHGSGEDKTLQFGNVLREIDDSKVAPLIRGFRERGTTGYGLPCDASKTEDGEVPEVCQMTRFCEEEDEIPICERSKCRCKPVFCSKASECAERDLCRPMDQEPVCELGSTTAKENGKEGTCSCQAKHIDCWNNGGNAYCAEQFNCTRWSYDVYRLPLCLPATDPGGLSYCECKESPCTYGNWWNKTLHGNLENGGDWSMCAELSCPRDPIFGGVQEPVCSWDSSSETNGTCRCR